MAEPSTHINYSFEDIQRYLQGKMTAAEMHNIEKAALQDSFLADAIEGYGEVDANIAKQHLNEIKAGLFAAEKRSKVIAFNRKTRWLRIAAMVIIIASVGVLGIYIFRNSGTQQQVAEVENESANTRILKDSATSGNATILPKKEDTDFVIAQNKPMQNPSLKQRPKTENAGILLSRDSSIEDHKTPLTAMVAPVLQDETASRSYEAAPLSNQKSDSAQNILAGKASGFTFLENTFNGKIVNQEKEPIPFATLTIDSTAKSSFSDASGNFRLRQKDSLINVTVSAVGYNNQNVTLKNNDSNIIELTHRKASIDEVAVTAAMGYYSAKPVGGWENFNNYVLGQINKDSSFNSNLISNDNIVEIEFLIDKAGNPYDIKILKSLDNQRNAIAIDILRSGPKWTNALNNDKVRILIAFQSAK